ncbi:LysR family transcriptional regulator [Methylobacterium organophilum]|uniref:LysR family transcriptional regulator n=1 Tax=Methylobacterium organophilum TaxID=410 RepID=UPI001F13FEEE|nr:LysR family transcriptional regulator [Methylobacterium organophilum]UMY17462.1 LysR family transcriptional regulator [Methylobacterium organophilum]
MSNDHLSWDDQRAFLSVLDTGSFSAAARALGLTQPTVRHRIEALERAIGQSLFVRSVNGLAPTPEARGLAAHARRMAYASEAFRREAAGAASEIAGPVRLSVSDFVGIEVVPPMLATLRERHPRLMVELLLTNANTDLPGQEADVAVRMARPSQASLVARHVGSIPLGFFAAPAYVDRNGLPETIADLPRHALIAPDRAQAYLAVVDRLSREAGGPLRIALRSDSHPAQLAAVRAGLGIGVVQVPVGARDLVRVLPDRVVHVLDTWIVAHEDVRRSARIDALFRHLVATFQAYCSDRPAGHRAA